MNNTRTNKEYLAAAAPEWSYPELDGEPPRGKKLNILTSGGIATTGQWSDDSNYIAWAHLIKGSKIKEHMVSLIRSFTGTTARKELMVRIMKNHLEFQTMSELDHNNSRHLYNALALLLSEVYPSIHFEFTSKFSDRVNLHTTDMSIMISYTDAVCPDKLDAIITLPSGLMQVAFVDEPANNVALSRLITSMYGCSLKYPRLDVTGFYLDGGKLFYGEDRIAVTNENNQIEFVYQNPPE